MNVNIDTSVVISSRIRLARNVAGYCFPCMLRGSEKEQELTAKITSLLKKIGGFDIYYMDKLPDREKRSFVERYLISKELASADGGAFAISNEGFSVMINEEDHLREQCIVRGYDLINAYKKISVLDGILGRNLTFARQGDVYFTACPSNLGTGMRASVMMFLPAIINGGFFGEICESASRYGLTVRGRYGEGSSNESYLCQVSNEITYKVSVKNILDLVTVFVRDAVELERSLRISAFNSNTDILADKVLRALGILENCLILSYDEFVSLICMVKLGLSLGFLKSDRDSGIDDLLMTSNSATLFSNIEKSSDDENKLRARYVRKALCSLNIRRNIQGEQ